MKKSESSISDLWYLVPFCGEHRLIEHSAKGSALSEDSRLALKKPSALEEILGSINPISVSRAAGVAVMASNAFVSYGALSPYGVFLGGATLYGIPTLFLILAGAIKKGQQTPSPEKRLKLLKERARIAAEEGKETAERVEANNAFKNSLGGFITLSLQTALDSAFEGKFMDAEAFFNIAIHPISSPHLAPSLHLLLTTTTLYSPNKKRRELQVELNRYYLENPSSYSQHLQIMETHKELIHEVGALIYDRAIKRQLKKVGEDPFKGDCMENAEKLDAEANTLGLPVRAYNFKKIRNRIGEMKEFKRKVIDVSFLLATADIHRIRGSNSEDPQAREKNWKEAQSYFDKAVTKAVEYKLPPPLLERLTRNCPWAQPQGTQS